VRYELHFYIHCNGHYFSLRRFPRGAFDGLVKTDNFVSSRAISRFLRKILHHEVKCLVINYLYVHGINQTIPFLRAREFMKKLVTIIIETECIEYDPFLELVL
jgi:hypothetical protein